MNPAAIERLLTPWTGTSSPGVVWAVTRGGRERASGAVGMADIAQGTPLDRRSVVRIGSQTKQFTVLLALLLEAEGRLSMADEVHRYAPWLPPTPWPVTLLHLATNTSGLREFLEMLTLGGIPLGAPVSRLDERAVIARHRAVNFQPGTQMIYCNTGFWLLSEIVEQVAGRSYDELLRERITGPLGMADTRLLPYDAQIVPRLSAQHTRGADGAWWTARWGLALGGEGGMVSTLDDMLRWQRNFAEPRVGSEALFARMATPITYANGARGLYAMGLAQERYR
ncbi:MAG: beta-lactamase family protein, partial [Acetobacteraceae bacterium]|nr:beta-lactamase family protein [Acetobacteraceae bacterium]